MIAPQCAKCGAHPFNLRPPGRFIVIADTDIGRLRNLLDKDVDADLCARCLRQVGVVPTVFVLFPDDALVLYAAGTLLTEASEAVKLIDWRPYLCRPDAVPHSVQYPDLDALRASVRQRLSARLPIVRPLLQAVIEGNYRLFLFDHWRDYRPAVFAALNLAVRYPDLDSHLDPAGLDDAQRATVAHHDLGSLVLPDTVVPEQRYQALLILQLRVWQALCGEWTWRILANDGDPTAAAVTSLREDLETYIVGGALWGGLKGPLALLFDEDLATGLSPYVWRALQAAVARALGEPNPQAEQWAEAFFAYEMACLLSPVDVPARLVAARLPAGFAHATIDYQSAWHAAAALYGTLDSGGPDGQLGARPLHEAYQIVHTIADKAGHPQLAAAVLETVLGSGLDATASADEIVTAVLPDASTRAVSAGLALAGLHLDKQHPTRRAEITDHVAQRLLAVLGLDAEADVIAWWANRLNRDQRFADTEQVLDAYPVPDGAPVPASTRARLWGARASALAGRGRQRGALPVWRQIVDLLADTADRALYKWARVNLGIALAKTGSPDQALTLFEDIAYGPDSYGGDPQLLALMAWLHARFGQSDRAVTLLADAQRLAGALPAAYRYAQQRAQQLVVLGRDGEAIQLLIELAQREQPHDLGALLAEAASWSMLLARDTDLPAAPSARARRMPTLLAELAERAAVTGDVTNHLALLSRRAEFAQLLGAAAGPSWEHVVGQRRHHGVPDNPKELVQAARARRTDGDLTGMRQLLGAVPSALARTYGAVADIELLVREPKPLLRPLAELAGYVVSGGGADWADVRLIAELQRDAVGRARTAYLDYGAAAEQVDIWLGDVASRVPLDAGALVVVEWIRTGEQSLCCVLTRADAGQEGSAFLSLAPVNPVVLQKQLSRALSDRTLRRSGSPLDDPGWRELASSMATEISAYARDGDHIVFLHNEVYANLPWHILIGARWTVSYAAGWTHLFGLLGVPPAPRQRIGVCTVPRFGDPRDIVEALRSTEHRAALAATDALRCPEEQCDRHYLEELMDSVDVALLLCHGYRPWRGEEIGLMLAHESQLPLADAVSSAKVLAGHLFSWRDCLRLKRAPRTVLSAACSSAHGYGAGLGDRLGLFNALRQAGTTAMVAPAWDVEAIDVLPVLDEVTARYLRGEPLGQALRAACQDAAHALPDWRAWSLALEGDWR